MTDEGKGEITAENLLRSRHYHSMIELREE